MSMFIDTLKDYKDRNISNFENDKTIVDTCAVEDSAQPFETGVANLAYNKGKWIIVELYDSKEEAQKGHNKWVKIMTAKKLPDTLMDVSSASIAQCCDLGGDSWRTYNKKKAV